MIISQSITQLSLQYTKHLFEHAITMLDSVRTQNDDNMIKIINIISMKKSYQIAITANDNDHNMKLWVMKRAHS